MAAVLGAIEVSRFWVAEPQGAGSAEEPPNAATGERRSAATEQPGNLTRTPPSLDQWLVERGNRRAARRRARCNRPRP